MKNSHKHQQDSTKHKKGNKSEVLKMILFMSFIPGIYLIGKLITELF